MTSRKPSSRSLTKRISELEDMNELLNGDKLDLIKMLSDAEKKRNEYASILTQRESDYEWKLGQAMRSCSDKLIQSENARKKLQIELEFLKSTLRSAIGDEKPQILTIGMGEVFQIPFKAEDT